MSNAAREASKRKFNCCMGTVSCLIVVMVAAVCYTLIAKAPVVFLQQAEAEQGQFDLRIRPSDVAAGRFLNYSQMVATTSAVPRYSYHTGRTQFATAAYGSECRKIATTTFNLPWGTNTPMSWTYVGDQTVPQLNSDYSCSNTSVNCVAKLCGKTQVQPTLTLFDAAEESRMGLGRQWNYPDLKAGEVLVSSDTATRLKMSAGDVILVSLPTFTSNTPWLRALTHAALLRAQPQGINSNASLLLTAAVEYFGATSYVPMTIKQVISDTFGKLGSTSNVIMADRNTFPSWVSAQLHPVLFEKNPSTLSDALRAAGVRWNRANETVEGDPYPASVSSLISGPSGQGLGKQVVSQVLWNMPPKRVENYMSSNYDTIQATVTSFASDALYFGGFTEITAELPILTSMRTLQFFSIYLGLILSIILTILFMLATMLIYSLLIISIETRAFQLGVHRMVGMTRAGIVKMLIVQAASFAIPAWVIGLIVSQVIALMITKRLEQAIQVPIERRLTNESIGVATFLGLFIPLVSSILPIRQALQQNLHETLDTRHSKTLGVKYSIERAEDHSFDVAWLVVGLGLTVFGFLIYYLLPLSLLTFNLALFFNIFFGILLGLLIGLILLSLNLEHLAERLVATFTLFWENRCIPFLVLKNLVAHRARNRKTTIMYALALGFIVFITVAYKMEITSAKYRVLKGAGSPLVISHSGDNYMYTSQVDAIEKVLESFKAQGIVDDWAWQTGRLDIFDGFDSTTISNLGHVYENGALVHAVSPNFFDVAEREFLITMKDDTSMTGMSLGEQLYTVRGSQSALIGSLFSTAIGARGLSSSSSFLLAFQNEKSDTQSSFLKFVPLKPLSLMESSPRVSMSRFPSKAAQPVLVSIPSILRLSQGTYQRASDLPMDAVLIRASGSASDQQIDALTGELDPIVSEASLSLFDFRTFRSTLGKSDSVMDLIFTAATYIAMFLCLFSLMASVYTNIYEQSKEIAVLRAMGLTRWQIIRLYVYEAFVLVTAASILGVCIGAIMAWTMMLQRVLFTQLPVPITFPYTLLGLVAIGAIICAFISSFFPARALNSKPVASIMNTFV